MHILFELHPYQTSDVRNVLKGLYDLEDIENQVSLPFVGYFYNPESSINDCVFILPKVLLKDVNVWGEDGKKKKIEVIAGLGKDEVKDLTRDDVVTPEDIVTPEGQKKFLTPEYRKFIYEFAVWIYRALAVYRKANPRSQAVYCRQLPQAGRGRRHQANTFLDVILSLIRFNQENQNFFLYTIKNLHSGHNRINWTRTISRSTALIQGDEVVYFDPVNKKRQINFDEELFIIYFSILNYLNNTFGFKVNINVQYEIIKGHQFERYINGIGKTRLRQIKYKYFSDKSLQLWDLCYVFFESAHKLSVNTNQKEYLLAKNFEIVFEAMIDELIGDSDIPKGLKSQYDGKRVDHMYTYRGLTNSDDRDNEIYYIGDSKYYKFEHKLGYNSIYKQFTYARNVVQWNINLFVNEMSTEGWTDDEKKDYKDDKGKYKSIHLRDDVSDDLTEGYNIIPNFFISAFVDKERKYVAEENIKGHQKEKDGKKIFDADGKPITQTYISYQFKDRLFDRDTLILSHYDVNFLYVIYLYARNKRAEKSAWRVKVRDIFREEIRKVLQREYQFYAMKSKGNMFAGEQFIRDHFKELQGKLFRPYGTSDIFSLALKRRDSGKIEDSDTYKLLEEFFEIEPVDLGENPKPKLDKKVDNYQTAHPYMPIPENLLPEYHIERYADIYFIVGLYHDKEHWDWITGKNDKGSLIYNVRLDKSRKGSMPKSRIRDMKPRFAILYEEGHEKGNKYNVFRIHDFAVMKEDRMRKALYPREPKGDYFIFRFDEEVTLGNLDVASFISDWRKANPDEEIGTPIFVKGEELLKYKK